MSARPDPLPEDPGSLSDGWRERYPELAHRYTRRTASHVWSREAGGRNSCTLYRSGATWWAYVTRCGLKSHRVAVKTFDDLHDLVIMALAREQVAS